MKKLLLTILLCIPMWLMAQTDSKYMEALPVKDGKITFSTEIKVPSMSKEQLYHSLMKWAESRFQPQDRCNARVLYTNKEEGSIAIGGDEYIVFKSASLSLDQTRIFYQLNIHCKEGICQIDMTRIRYWYNEERNGGDKFTAEEWIADEIALNKTKTKMYPKTGKFRTKTIDLKDELINNISSVLREDIQEKRPQPTNEVIVSQPSSTNIPVVTEKETTQSPTTTQDMGIEEKIKKAIRITLTAGNDEQIEISKECWGGFGELFGKKVAHCLIDNQKTMSNMLIKQSDTYTLNFYSPESNEPSVVITCKKMMQQESIKNEEAKKLSINADPDRTYNLYVGEIIE